MSDQGASASHVLKEARDGVLVLTMNRPEKKNALSLDMYASLVEGLRELETTPGLRCALITGSGDSFTSGNDVMDFMRNPPTDENSPVAQFLEAITTLEKPLVAAVNGNAVGIGVTMLLHCDLAYAADTAVFRTPFVNLGLCPEAGSSLLLPALMGHRRAAELLMLGDKIEAASLVDHGLLNAVCPGPALMEHAMAKAVQLAGQAPGALRLTKRLMRAPYQATLPEVMREEGREFMARLMSPEAAEGFQAFLQRRKPDFSAFE